MPDSSQPNDLTGAMARADTKATGDANAYRRRPTVNQDLTPEERQELTVRKHLMDGFYKAKAAVNDAEYEFTDVQIGDQMTGIARLLIEREKKRREAK